MQIEINNRLHLQDFIRLNEIWIAEHFALEAADLALAENPAKVINSGGFVFSLSDDDQVVGVCALFRERTDRYELARMAVAPDSRGRGYGRALLAHALEHARAIGAKSVYLLSNTALKPAIALYESFGFVPISTGQHSVYARCNIVMELIL